MLYQPLKTQTIKLAPTETQEYNAGSGVVFVPQPASKIYLHWMAGDKIRSTFTMTYATRVEGEFKIINGSGKETSIMVIPLG